MVKPSDTSAMLRFPSFRTLGHSGKGRQILTSPGVVPAALVPSHDEGIYALHLAGLRMLDGGAYVDDLDTMPLVEPRHRSLLLVQRCPSSDGETERA